MWCIIMEKSKELNTEALDNVNGGHGPSQPEMFAESTRRPQFAFAGLEQEGFASGKETFFAGMETGSEEIIPIKEDKSKLD